MHAGSAKRDGIRRGGWPTRYGLVLAAVVALLSACSPRYTVYELTCDGFTVDEDAWLAPDTSLVVAYDFWSIDGQPFVSVLNPDRDTAWLDLARSTVTTEEFGRVTLLDVLGGGPGSQRRDVRAAYPELTLTEGELEPQLLLLPETWVSFYGLAATDEGARAWSSGKRESAGVATEYVWTRKGASVRTRHEFGTKPVERLRRREYRHYGATLAAPDRFYVDRGPARRQESLRIALEVGTTVLFAM